MASAYTGHQEAHRSTTKDERQACGRLHAPEVVNPPANRCDVCGDQWVAVQYLDRTRPHACQPCRDAFSTWYEILNLSEAMSFQEAQTIFLAEAFNRVPPKAAEATPKAPVKLGQTEIEMGDGQYHRPGLSVRHSSQEKRLVVTLYANGRTGKQKNHYPIRVKRNGDQVEIGTQGASKSIVSLAEWQAFIDQVDVHVCDISRNTVQLTPELVKMARDVKAYRRNEPTDLEWAAENGAAVKPASEADLLKVWQKWMDAEVEANHNAIILAYARDGLILIGDMDLIKQTGPRDFKDMVFRYSGIQLAEPGEQHEKPECRYSLALANRGSELLPKNNPEYPARPHIIPNPDSVYVERLNELSEMTSRNTDDLVRKSADAWNEMLRNHASLAAQTSADVKPATTKFTDHEGKPIDDLEAAAMSKAPIDPKKVEELLEAIKVALAEPGNADAQILPGGFFLRRSANRVFVHLAHSNHPNHITVGMDDGSRMDFISSRGEIRAYMLKATEGPRPPKHPALQPINTEEKAA